MACCTAGGAIPALDDDVPWRGLSIIQVRCEASCILPGFISKAGCIRSFSAWLFSFLFATSFPSFPGKPRNDGKQMLPVCAHSSSQEAAKEASHFECLCPTRQDNGLWRYSFNHCLAGRSELKSCLSLCHSLHNIFFFLANCFEIFLEGTAC